MFENQPQSASRRLPVYLLLDTSGSMGGDKIQAVNQGVQLLYNELLGNPQALDTAYLCVITFDSSARMMQPLTDLMSFTPPTLTANGATRLAEAIDLLNESLDRDIKKTTAEERGDYKPLVFVFTDGMPTDRNGNRSDDWRQAAERLRNRSTNKAGTIVALGVGSDREIDESVLKGIGTVALRMKDVNPDAIQAFFKWVSASVSVASVNANKGQAGAMNAPQMPGEAGIQIVI